jgi:hypothetical protein
MCWCGRHPSRAAVRDGCAPLAVALGLPVVADAILRPDGRCWSRGGAGGKTGSGSQRSLGPTWVGPIARPSGRIVKDTGQARRDPGRALPPPDDFSTSATSRVSERVQLSSTCCFRSQRSAAPERSSSSNRAATAQPLMQGGLMQGAVTGARSCLAPMGPQAAPAPAPPRPTACPQLTLTSGRAGAGRWTCRGGRGVARRGAVLGRGGHPRLHARLDGVEAVARRGQQPWGDGLPERGGAGG